jgi:hypothetical protein
MFGGNVMNAKSSYLLSSVLNLCVLAGVLCAGEQPDQYAEEIRPLLARYCLDCHGETAPKAELNLASFDGQNLFSRPKTWNLVRERLAAGEMPPAEEAQPTGAERSRLIAFSENVLARHTIDGRPDPGPLAARRLNVREHMNMFRDLAVAKDRAEPRKAAYAAKKDGSTNLYHSVIPPAEHPCNFVVRALPQDTQDGGFDSIGDNLSIPPFLMERYFRVSKTLLDEMFSAKGKDEHGRYQWRLRELVEKAGERPLPRGVETRREAVTEMLREFASRAFRRPVTLQEVEKYMQLYDASQKRGEDFERSIRLPLQAILVSPRFTVLWAENEPTRSDGEAESDAQTKESPSADRPGVRPLDDYELATRLSIFLWSSVPDRELRELAEEGRLQDSEILEQQVRRMLGDRRITDGLFAGFVCQWLQLDLLDRNAPDAEAAPEYFQNNLAELMKSELMLFADVMLVEDRSILEFLDADWGLLCYPLAEHYGIDDFPGKKSSRTADPRWYRVKFRDKRRGGVLTMGKVLTGTSQPTRTSPVHRGKWLLETVLGAPPPPPPPDVNNVLAEPSDDGTERLTVPQLLARHRSNPACHACHRRIDPLGVALENFDMTGRWRDLDQGRPIDARGELVDGAKFDGVAELKALLMSRKEEFVRSFSRQMLAYALGRRLEFYDRPAVERIVQAVIDDDYRFSRVVVEVARSYPFRHRRTN